MEVTRQNPGKVYVGVLPGHDRPAFVRKRRSSHFRLPRLFDPRRSYSAERTYRCVVRSPSCYRADSHLTTVHTEQPVYVNDPGPRPLPHYVHLPPYPTSQTGKHTCGACGKFRSPSYCKRHPLADGEQPKPSLCRKCIKGSTESGSDDNYAKYRKEQKRRRRQRPSSSDERYERYRRERRNRNRKQRPSSGDYSYERFREKERYRGPRRVYSVDERSSYSDWEQEKQPRVIYVSRSSSHRNTRSSSGGGPSVVVSYKSSEPRELRRSSRSRSSAEEIRVVRRIIERPEKRPRARPSVSERSYRSHYRSVSGSSGGKSVRFRSPLRRYRGHGYDGEMASYENRDQNSLRRSSERIRGSLGSPDEIDRGVYFDERRAAGPAHAQHQRRDSGISCSKEPERPPSRSVRYVRGSSEIRDAASRYKRDEDGRHSSTTSFMSGTRGRSLSADRRALERAGSRERLEADSRREPRTRYRTSSDGSSANYVPRTYC